MKYQQAAVTTVVYLYIPIHFVGVDLNKLLQPRKDRLLHGSIKGLGKLHKTNSQMVSLN